VFFLAGSQQRDWSIFERGCNGGKKRCRPDQRVDFRTPPFVQFHKIEHEQATLHVGVMNRRSIGADIRNRLESFDPLAAPPVEVDDMLGVAHDPLTKLGITASKRIRIAAAQAHESDLLNCE